MKFKLFGLLFLLLMPIFISKENDDFYHYTYVDKEISTILEISDELEETIKNSMTQPVLKTYYGPMTAYGPDCLGCIGITASGYNVLHGNINYYDKTYGEVRILASDKTLPFGTIVKITGLDDYPKGILAIVLDRGSAIGFNKNSYFDLLYASESATLTFGCQYAQFDILRLGY